MTRSIVACLALGLIAIATHFGFGLYAPHPGEIAAGEEARAPTRQGARDLAVVEVRAEMASGPNALPTLANVVRFYGLESDTLGCTLLENDKLLPRQDQIPELAARSESIGSTVTLCLNG